MVRLETYGCAGRLVEKRKSARKLRKREETRGHSWNRMDTPELKEIFYQIALKFEKAIFKRRVESRRCELIGVHAHLSVRKYVETHGSVRSRIETRGKWWQREESRGYV